MAGWPNFERKTKRYLTDLTDEEWARIEPFLPGAAKSGRRARTDLREVLNAIRYLARSGVGQPAASWRQSHRQFIAHKQHGGGPRNRFPVLVGVGVADRRRKNRGESRNSVA